MKPRRRARPLTRDELVDAALRIVDEEGLGALTMRHLGAALDVEAMALYRHVPNKESLLDLTVDRMRSELRLEEPPPEEASALLEAIFVAYLQVLMAHPNMLPLATRRTAADGTSGLEFMVAQGMDAEDAVELYQSLTALTVGYAVVGTQTDTWDGVPDGLAERMTRWEVSTFRRAVRQILTGYGQIGKGARR